MEVAGALVVAGAELEAGQPPPVAADEVEAGPDVGAEPVEAAEDDAALLAELVADALLLPPEAAVAMHAQTAEALLWASRAVAAPQALMTQS